MAKRTYKILRFDGGINSDADPRDIGDNQFADLQNIAVDEMGKMIVIGDANTSYKTLTGDITAEGRGLISVSTDYAGLLSSGTSTDKVYYLVENGTSIQGISSDGTETGTALTSTGINDPTYYFVDGGLRVGDGDHAGGNTVKWRGYIKSNTYGGIVNAAGVSSTDADATVGGGWDSENAAIAGCFPTYAYKGTNFCRNATVVNVVDNTTGSSGVPRGYAFVGESTDGKINYTTGAVTAGFSTLEWGLALEYDEDVNGTGTWMPQASVKYLFHVSTMYDNQTQESIPQIMDCMTSYHLLTGSAGTYEHATGKQQYIPFLNGNTTVGYGENVAVKFKPVVKFNGTTTSHFNFGAPSEIYTSGGNERISGCRIYWSSSEDGHTSLWQIMELDFLKGVKPIGADGGQGGTAGFSSWYAFEHDSANFYYQQPDWGAWNAASDITWTNPPRYFQYDVLNAHAADDVIDVESFKTAVVANRRIYIGNIGQNGEIKSDRMLKSPVNQFDKFPSINNIDVAINDGDEIIALVEYADRILQFKKNTCYIINVSGNSEYLEAEHRYKGISNPGAVCRTDYGCAWVNQDGCFLYDGQQVTDLLEDKGVRKIKGSTWGAFLGSGEERIGFHKKKRQLIVKGTSTAAYVFDMVTKSWTRGTSSFDTNTNSNFINDLKDGKLLIHDGSASLDRWNSDATASKSIKIRTKDVDFGEPAVRKKLYKIYVTYKGDGSSVTPLFFTNGAFPTSPYSFVATGFSDVADWTRLELKPATASEANSIYSCQLYLSGTAGTDFEINDISFIYRTKGIK